MPWRFFLPHAVRQVEEELVRRLTTNPLFNRVVTKLHRRVNGIPDPCPEQRAHSPLRSFMAHLRDVLREDVEVLRTGKRSGAEVQKVGGAGREGAVKPDEGAKNRSHAR